MWYISLILYIRINGVAVRRELIEAGYRVDPSNDFGYR